MGESVEVKNQKTRQVLRFNIGFESQFNVVPLFSKYGLWFQESFLLLTNEVTNFFFSFLLTVTEDVTKEKALTHKITNLLLFRILTI